MVVLICLLSVSTDTVFQSYNRTGHNGHRERTCLSGKGYIVVGGKMSRHGLGKSSPENVCTNRIGDIVLNRTSAKELYLNNGCLNIDTAVSDDIY